MYLILVLPVDKFKPFALSLSKGIAAGVRQSRHERMYLMAGSINNVSAMSVNLGLPSREGFRSMNNGLL